MQARQLLYMFMGYLCLTPSFAYSDSWDATCNGRYGGYCRTQPPGSTLRPGRCNIGERHMMRSFYDSDGRVDSYGINQYNTYSNDCCDFSDWQHPCSLSNRNNNCEFDGDGDGDGDSIACMSCTTYYKADTSSTASSNVFTYHAMSSNGPISGSSYGADWIPSLNGVKSAACWWGSESPAYCPYTMDQHTQPWTGYEGIWVPDFHSGCLCSANEFAMSDAKYLVEDYDITTTQWVYPRTGSVPYAYVMWDFTYMPGHSYPLPNGNTDYDGFEYWYNQNVGYSYTVFTKGNKCIKCPKINGIQTVSGKGAGLPGWAFKPIGIKYPGSNDRTYLYDPMGCQCPAGYESDTFQCVTCPVGKYSRLEYIPYPWNSYNGVAIDAEIAEDYNLYGYAPYYAMYSPINKGDYLLADQTCAYGPCEPGMTASETKFPGNGASGSLNRQLWNSNCISCATGFVTPSTGSTSRAQCTECAAGYWKDTAPNPDVCVPCAVGKYSTITASYSESVCTWCPANSWTDASASDSLADCRCNAGYFGSSGNCQACPSNSHSVVGSTSCYCNSGYYSTTSALTTTDSCVACPSNSQTVGGTDGQTFCVCNTGYYGTEAKVENDCTACPLNSQQPDIDQPTCLCNAGYTGIGTTSQTCSFCEAGTYKNTIGSSACVSCGLVQSNTPRDGCLPCSSINAYGDNTVVGMQVSMQRELVRAAYPRMSQSQCVHGDGKDFDIAHRLEFPDYCMTSSGSTSLGFEYLTHYKTKQMLIMSDRSTHYRLYAANLSHTDPRLFRLAGGTNVASDADGVVSAGFVDGPRNTGKLYRVGAIYASDVHHVVFMHDYTTIRAVDLRDNAWGEIFHVCGPNSATGGYLPSTGSCSLTGNSAPRFARQYSGSYSNYLGESFDGKYLYSANYHGITRLELTSTNGNRPTGIESRYFMGRCRTTGSDCQGQQSTNTYHIGTWTSCTNAAFESGRVNFVCSETNGQVTCENTPSPENFYTHTIAMTIAGTNMYVMATTCAFVINVDHTSTQYAQFTRALSVSNANDYFGYSSLRIRSSMTSSADNSTIWIFNSDYERIIEWNTITHTFTPTVVWSYSTSGRQNYNSKQSYVLQPRQANSGPMVYGLQFANEKLYWAFSQSNRFYAETQVFEIPVTGSCWNCPANSGISETALWTARCIEFGMTLSLTARDTNDWVCCASGDTTCTFPDILDALMMSSSSNYVKSSNRCSRPAQTVTTADTGNANWPDALRGTPCILEEAYRPIDATMCACNAGFEKNDYGQCESLGCDVGQRMLSPGVCESCAAGTYMDATLHQHTACFDCLDNANSPPASTSIDNCTCNAGYERSGESCSACTNGYFKADSGDHACTACPVDSQSISLTACACNVGYIKEGEACTACVVGKYKETVGDTVDCGSGVQTTCCDCGNNPPRTTVGAASTDAATDCVCVEGAHGATCQFCDVGTYKDAIGTQACSTCPTGSTTLVQGSVALSDCVSAPGFYDTGGGFTECASGTYQFSTDQTTCLTCPTGSTSSNLPRTAETDCVCDDVGYQLAVSSSYYCNCQAGYYFDSNLATCHACAVDTYCTGVEASYLACPSFSTSPALSDALVDCQCNAGYSGPDGGTCAACAVGTYKNSVGSESCSLCVANSNSLEASDDISDCTCNGGYSGPLGGPCSACTAGTYKDAIGSAECTACAQNETSPEGSVSADACVCVAGYGHEEGDPYKFWPMYFFNFRGNMHATWSSNIDNSVILETAFQDCANDVTCDFFMLQICQPTFNCGGTSKYRKGIVTSNMAWDSGGGGYVKYLSVISPDTSDSLLTQMCNNKHQDAYATELMGFAPMFPAYAEVGVSNYRQAGDVSVCDIAPDGQYYNVEPPTEGCVSCAAGTFKTADADTACDGTCPVDSTSPEGSDAPGDCVCNAGYSGANGGSCTVCPANTYKDMPGDSACLACAANSQSLAGSDAATDCQCSAGYAGPDGGACPECAANLYKSTVGTALCEACAVNSQSPAASVADTACECNAGYAGPDGGPCTFCSETQYQPSVGEAACLTCPSNSAATVESGRDEQTDCLCNAGYTGADGGVCSACAAGKYKTTTGSAACSDCDVNAGSAEASTAVTDCVCNAGYEGANGATCVACGVDQYEDTSTNACVACPDNSQSPSLSSVATACQCNVGYTGANGGPCSACPVDTYKDTVGDAVCKNCDSNMYSAQASTNDSDCLCNAGYSRGIATMRRLLTTSPCQECAVNTYCPVETAVSVNSINDCPDDSQSLAGSDAATDCQCNVGYAGADGGPCSACPENTYKDSVGTAACTDCTDHSSSAVASGDVSDCVCDSPYVAAGDGSCDRTCAAGFEGSGGEEGEDTCVGCQQSFYKTTSGTHNCQACPANSHSTVRNQTSIDACVCDQGYLWNGTGCDQCESGTFNNRANQTDCFDCFNTEAQCNSMSAARRLLTVDSLPGANPPYPFQYWPLYNLNTAGTDIGGWVDLGPGTATPSSYPTDAAIVIGQQACLDTPECIYVTFKAFYGYSDGFKDTASYKLQSAFSYWRRYETYWISVKPSWVGPTYDAQAMCDNKITSWWRAVDAVHGYNGLPVIQGPEIDICEMCNTGPNCIGTYYGLIPEPTTETASVESASHTSCPGLCVAPAGYRVNAAGNNVELCPSNHYQDGSASNCTRCPWPSTYSSAGGLTSVAECECRPGYTRLEGVCTACDIGKYKPHAGDAVCTACGSHATTESVASVNVLACLCIAEYEPVAENCIECVEHAYKNIVGNQSCILCGANSSLLIDSAHVVESCECKPGYESLSVGVCTACPHGKFKADFGNVHCDSCGDFTTTAQIASTNQTQCQCMLGYEDGPVGGPDVDCAECVCVLSCAAGLYGSAGTCQLCEEGKYRDNVDLTVRDCQLCSDLGTGVRTASRSGSIYTTNCSCPEGYMGLSSDKFVVVQSIERAPDERLVSESVSAGVARIAESTNELMRLDIADLTSDVTISVNSRVVFEARSFHGSVFSVSLQGMRGDLLVQASSGTYTLWTHVERDITVSASPSWLGESMLQLLRTFALQKRVCQGDYVFDSTFYSDAQCVVCAPGLVCEEFI